MLEHVVTSRKMAQISILTEALNKVIDIINVQSIKIEMLEEEIIQLRENFNDRSK